MFFLTSCRRDAAANVGVIRAIGAAVSRSMGSCARGNGREKQLSLAAVRLAPLRVIELFARTVYPISRSAIDEESRRQCA